MIPRSSRLRSASSPTFGISRVISSGPSFVSRASDSYSSIWIGSEYIILNKTFTHNDRILIVVSIPCHESYDNVTTKRKFSFFHRWSVCKNITRFHTVSYFNNRTLVIASTLVGTNEVFKLIDRKSPLTSLPSIVSIRRTRISFASTCSTIPSYFATTAAPESRADMCSIPVPTNGASGFSKRNSLTLHVRSHKRTVGVIIFKERDTCSRSGNNLFRRNIHVIDLFTFEYSVIPLETTDDFIIHE